MQFSQTEPKVSVCVITYNQERYIGLCLQSILDQETDFPFEVIVGDDCSTDGTRQVIEEFVARYPDVMHPIYQKENIGAGVNNLLAVHAAARGQYVAHVDGDDYLLPGKLQVQVELLDSDPSCNVSFHRMLLCDTDGLVRRTGSLQQAGIETMRFDRAALLQFMAVGLHSSKMYRRSAASFDLPDIDIVDYFLNVEQVGDGVARYAGSEPYGVYRLSNGIASGGERSRRALNEAFKYFLAKYPKHRLEINTAVLTCLVSDLRSLRNTWRMFAWTWLLSFHFKSPLNLWRSLGFLRTLRFDR